LVWEKEDGVFSDALKSLVAAVAQKL
jgi:hypothetical protein